MSTAPETLPASVIESLAVAVVRRIFKHTQSFTPRQRIAEKAFDRINRSMDNGGYAYAYGMTTAICWMVRDAYADSYDTATIDAIVDRAIDMCLTTIGCDKTAGEVCNIVNI